MRAVLTLPTPHHDLTIDELREALAPTTWLPRSGDAAWLAERTDALVAKFPRDLQAQLVDAPRLLIQVGLSVEGLVSLERTRAVMIRLIHEGADIGEIKDAVTMIAASLPAAFQVAIGAEGLMLHTEIDIRQNNDGATVAKGEIVTPHQLRLLPYVRTERRREYKLLVGLLLLLAITLGSAVALEVLHPRTASALDVLRGYSERISSAFAVALLTTAINLLFEHRDWRSEETEVRWLFG